ncbi:tRNA (adenosine(37)-N6)-threonylcarbamoyltransferase complex transferase subunit TsaD [Ureaplasma canigenitalium]|uniref:tRNA (adenosine(37)-N6)-threonylcarbamoyltransferase complex transferase subunit TsaD n=1 Tax=Ureaplasma canigenitalium TaxID=42092 RepID=UPI0004E12B48|nr:tRNA (adenosine(37)-N6)-threonylcarbamoyltransferase complex transferase subunit TsaD [Ureaplasma canigenitalium]
MKDYLLSIESSCDETSIAIFLGNELKAHIIASSSDLMKEHGGVVPEVASRMHEKNIVPALKTALGQAGIDLFDIKKVAYTACPGLPGGLHVGKIFAFTLACLLDTKPIPINHLHAHIFSALLSQKITFPLIGLVVSGGESCIYLVRDFDDITELNKTSDDAVGEAYDKIGRALGYQYPCGPVIDQNYDDAKANLIFCKQNKIDDQLSYSGIKTAIINFIHNKKQKNEKIDQIAIGSSFQKTVVNELIAKINYYCDKYNIHNVIIGGGVSANSFLRKRLSEENYNNLYLPDKKFTGDNAAMIGIYAYYLDRYGKESILI